MFKRKYLLYILSIIAIFSLLMIIIKLIFPSYRYIFGTWYIDNTTYIFKRNKKGSLNVNDEKYLFNYSIKDAQICLHFTDTNTEDKCYLFNYENDNLILKDDSNKFVFNKEK